MEDWIVTLITAFLYCVSILGGMSILGYTGYKIFQSLAAAKKIENQYKLKLLEAQLKGVIDDNDRDLLED